MRSAARSLIVPIAWIAAVATALLALFPRGFPNYDTIYSLLWGRELAEGLSPDRGAPLPPTPHPLAELWGLAASPLGGGAIDATMVGAYVALGLVGYLVYRLGALWFDRPVGALAALIVLTRAPYLSNGLRAYIDLPYIALALAALVLVTRGGPRPTYRNALAVLALLALAGLLRPEAWLFSIAYLAYLYIDPTQLPLLRRRRQPSDPGSTHVEEKMPPEPGSPYKGEEGVPLEPADTQNRGLIRPRFVGARGTPSSPSPAGDTPSSPPLRPTNSSIVFLPALALAAPILWALFDWITAGSPTYSFTGTRETVETLERQTGPVDLVLYGPRRLGEVLQWPGMVGAAGGALLAAAVIFRGRRRSQSFPPYDPEKLAIGLVSAALALAAFAILASAGLAIIPRYTMLAAAILAIFAAFALLGWRLLEHGDPWRRAWQGLALAVAALFVIWGPNQYDLLHRVDVDLTNQARIESDLNDLARSGAFADLSPSAAGHRGPPCLPISVPNHRAVPRLAFQLELPPSRIVSYSQQRLPRRGYLLEPASPFVVRNFVLDPNDPTRFATTVPPGFREVARNRSWVLHRRC